MKQDGLRKQQNTDKLISLTAIICLFVILGVCFDFYYDLNDDVLIKDILSGAYSGTPDAHSIQMLYPVSWIISLLYRFVSILPWQGIFLCGIQGVCFYLILQRSLTFTESKWGKIFITLAESVVILTLCTWELVIVQYTVTSALLAATACFLVYTQENRKTDKGINADNQENIQNSNIKTNKLAIILVILAFNIRSEMLLLMSPFIAVTGILRWSEEQEIFSIDIVKKYLGMVGMILAGLGVSLLIDVAAYCGEDWKNFRDFFDARTKVYDYTWYPEYEEAEEFYREIGLSPAQVTLIDNYNFGLDESIDADDLWNIAEYSEATGSKEPLSVQIKDAVADYKWRTFHEQDAPYNYFVITAYIMVAALAVLIKDRSALWKLPLLAAFRTIPWMYVILAKRVPNRISHPLYYIELVILCAWILRYFKRITESSAEDMMKNILAKKRACASCAILLSLFALIRLPLAWNNVSEEMQRRESVNAVMEAFDDYAKQNPDHYYYMDVYSTVPFSEKMFHDADNRQKNYDILGGWADRSPLQKEAVRMYHNDALSRAELLLLDNFYFVCEPDTDLTFIMDFYSGQGMDVSPIEVDQITAHANSDMAECDQTATAGSLIIYQIQITGNNMQ